MGRKMNEHLFHYTGKQEICRVNLPNDGTKTRSNPAIKITIFCFYTILVYNISMNTKNTTGFERVHKILGTQNGIVRTADLVALGIPTAYLSIMEKRGDIERISWGVYQAPSLLEDEFFLFQSKYKAAYFSHETALYLHDLTDRTPLFFTVSVPSTYHSSDLSDSSHKVFYVRSNMLKMGIIHIQSPHGNTLKVTGVERTIVDLLRSRSRVEDQIIFDALKRYARLKSKDVDLLFRYAESFRVHTILRPYMEVLL
jgi:hypothetical protein